MVKKNKRKTVVPLNKDSSKTRGEHNLLTLTLDSDGQAEEYSPDGGATALIMSKKIQKRGKGRKLEVEKIEPQTELDPPSKSNVLEIEKVYCHKHRDSLVEFMCIDPDYTKELCSNCLLEHKDRIKSIYSIKQLVDNFREKIASEPVDQFKDKIQSIQKISLSQLERVSDKIIKILHRNINAYKERLISEDQQLAYSVARKAEFKKYFLQETNSFATCTRNSQSNFSNSTVGCAPPRLSRKSVEALKSIIKCQANDHTNGFVIEEELIQRQLKTILQNNIVYVPNGFCANTTTVNTTKTLHWFEWDSRHLHLFNVTDYTHNVVKLVIQFKVPSFSRSIMAPDGSIYLIGGEEKRDGAKKECYVINPFPPENSKILTSKAPMLVKKYDFTICYLLGRIYSLCGKNSNGSIVNLCESYDVEKDSWKTIAPAKKKRYAAAAATLRESGKLYLFGGRGDQQNEMVSDIEEYDSVLNEWKILELTRPADWKRVEVCAAAQIRKGEIIVFGGSDINVEDSRHSFIIKFDENKIEKGCDLKKPHVFVSTPFVYGNFLFAVGNEYYVKERTIHRYDIQKDAWDIVF